MLLPSLARRYESVSVGVSRSCVLLVGVDSPSHVPSSWYVRLGVGVGVLHHVNIHVHVTRGGVTGPLLDPGSVVERSVTVPPVVIFVLGTIVRLVAAVVEGAAAADIPATAMNPTQTSATSIRTNNCNLPRADMATPTTGPTNMKKKKKIETRNFERLHTFARDWDRSPSVGSRPTVCTPPNNYQNSYTRRRAA